LFGYLCTVKEILQTFAHFEGGRSSECHGQNPLWGNALFEKQMSQAVDEGPSFSRAGACCDERGLRIQTNSGSLLFV
jgi:hypothetical protein